MALVGDLVPRLSLQQTIWRAHKENEN
jgi:hypothetical protein